MKVWDVLNILSPGFGRVFSKLQEMLGYHKTMQPRTKVLEKLSRKRLYYCNSARAETHGGVDS